MDRERDHGVELGRWVRAKRESLHLTQEQLATDMSYEFDVPTNWVSQLEAGRKKFMPDFAYIEALASGLHVLPTDVLRGAGMYPTDVEQPIEHSPGTATIHALVDMIDWVSDPQRRDITESFLRVFLDRDRKASQPQPSAPGTTRGQR